MDGLRRRVVGCGWTEEEGGWARMDTCTQWDAEDPPEDPPRGTQDPPEDPPRGTQANPLSCHIAKVHCSVLCGVITLLHTLLLFYLCTFYLWDHSPTPPPKVFYRENLERVLEKQRDTELRAVCRIIYHVILTVVTRRRFLKAKERIIKVQKFCKVR